MISVLKNLLVFAVLSAIAAFEALISALAPDPAPGGAAFAQPAVPR